MLPSPTKPTGLPFAVMPRAPPSTARDLAGGRRSPAGAPQYAAIWNSSSSSSVVGDAGLLAASRA